MSPALAGSGPEIDAGNGDLAAVSAASMEALQRANDPPIVFRHGGLLVRLEHDDRGIPGTRALGVDRLRHRLARVARFTRPRKGRKGRVPAEPPILVVRDILATPEPDFPLLSRIVEAPVFAPDGTLQTAPGYHPSSLTYFAPAPGFTVPEVPERPTAAEVAAARDLWLEELLGGFPFVGPSEEAHALAAGLLPFARDLVDGPTPLHLVEKPSPGTGATLLVEVLLFPALGRIASGMTEGTEEEEWRKRLTALLLRGPTAVLIDNLRRRLDSAALSSAITASFIEDRVLGASEMVYPPVRCVWLASANNPALSNEMARRTVRIRLDARTDRPWLRPPETFRHPDLLGWTRANRGALVRAALVLIRAWLVAGRPEPKGLPKLGMFESWSSVMGGILETASVPSFLGNLTDFYDTADAEGKEWRSFVGAWWEAHHDRPVGVADLFTTADSCDFDLGDGNERSRRTRFGKMLAAARDRRFGGFRIVEAGKVHRSARWRLHAEGDVGDVGDVLLTPHARAPAQETPVGNVPHVPTVPAAPVGRCRTAVGRRDALTAQIVPPVGARARARGWGIR